MRGSTSVTVEELLVHRSGLMRQRRRRSDLRRLEQARRRRQGLSGAIQAVLSEYLAEAAPDRASRGPNTPTATPATRSCSAIIEEQTGQSLRGLLPRGGVRQARHRRAEAASRLADAVGRGRLVRSGPGLSRLPRHLRSVASVPAATASRAGSTRRRRDGRPTNTRPLVCLGVNTWAGSGRWAVSHGGILNSRRQDAGRAGRPKRRVSSSHAVSRVRRRHRRVHRAGTGTPAGAARS